MLSDTVVQLHGTLKLRCAWRTTKELVIGTDSISYRVEKELRKAVGGGNCVRSVEHPKPHGEALNLAYLRQWIKVYWEREEAQPRSESQVDYRARMETLKAERTAGRGGGRSMSHLRSAELVREFLRLEEKHDAEASPQRWHPLLMVEGEKLERGALKFATRSSFAGAEWPAEFSRVVQPQRQGEEPAEPEPELPEEDAVVARVAQVRLQMRAASAGHAAVAARPRRSGVRSVYARP